MSAEPPYSSDMISTETVEDYRQPTTANALARTNMI